MRSLRIAAVLALVGATPLFAQSGPLARHGFSLGFGLGAGSAGLSCDGCSTDRRGSISGYFSMGGAVRPDLVVSGELNAWSKSENSEDVTIGYLMATTNWYPQSAAGFYFKGGLGLGRMTYTVSDAFGSSKLQSTGFGWQLGMGYDWRVAPSFSLTPYVQYLSTAGAKATIDGTSTGETLNSNVMQFGIGFTWP